MTITKFFDADVRPPKGGWSVTIKGNRFEAHSASQAAEKLKKWRKQTGTFVSDMDIEREIWAIYCDRQPERCGATPKEAQQIEAGRLIPRELTKEFVGPIIWRFLNIAAATFTPDTIQAFVGILGHVSHLLECPVCKHEWQQILQELSNSDPGKIFTSRYAACHWVNSVHNRVNTRAGKAEYPYSSMVKEYGAPAFQS